MKVKLHTTKMKDPNITNSPLSLSHSQPGKFQRTTALLGAAAAGLLLTTQPTLAHDQNESHDKKQAQTIGNIFVIAMENHNFTQPNPTANPQQIFGNPAAPYINSLITPGNSNAVHVSYATAYYNAGVGVHPSEPNYVWAEAGSDFGVHTDADPNPTNGNTFYNNSIHLTAQLNAAGISWKNYQEDVELSLSPTNSASGTNAPVPNPYYGTTQFNYAVKHNPMAFFSDTAVQNVYPLPQFFADLSSNSLAKYTWITPNQFNDAHSALNGGFTYQGTNFTGDQASIAQGDNFLATVIPQIMASPAYQNNGVIIIWWDESERGDTTNQTIPEIIISPLAKGNAYASSVPINHSSDIQTMEEIFGLPAINNPIPLTETDVTGTGYNNVATVNDLSDLFVAGAIPAAPSVTVTQGGFEWDHSSQHVFQVVHLKNTGNSPVSSPLWLALDNLSPNATLLGAYGKTAVLAPLGSPYVSVSFGGEGDDNNVLRPHESKTVKLEFLNATSASITYTPRVMCVTPTL
ncbi:MAG: phosphoesterase [Pedosphaera sp.]|nr:phosphoesterase [Pedosphaera sp.]